MCNDFNYDIRCDRKHLNLDASSALANALVSSRLGYSNSLLHSVRYSHVIIAVILRNYDFWL